MANPGLGFRTVNSILAEVSLHLVEPLCNTTITAPISNGVQTPLVGSTVGIYVGALLVVDLNTVSQEVVTVTAVVPGISFTANFANTHLAGTVILTPTFPTQQPTDPFFTQPEMLGYLSRAQNEFLARVPSIFQLFQQLITVGVVYQPTPATCIEINRIAISAPDVALTSLTRTAGVVTAITASPHNLIVGEKFTIFGTTGNPLTDPTFSGSFTVTTVINPTRITYAQALTNSTSTGGFLGLWTRMYETSQEELTMADRNWMTENIPIPTRWFEDRAGNYRWGIGSMPSSNYPVELLCSVRDTDTLALTDGFLVPDPLLHYIKYRTLEYAWTKDGVQSNAQMAQYCHYRFENGIIAAERWLDGVLTNINMNRKAGVGR